MKKLIKIIGIAIGVIIALAILGEIFGGDSKSSSTASQPSPTVSDNGTVPQPVQPAKNVKTPVAELSATQLRSKYMDNEVAGDNAYKGKLIKVSATVAKVEKDVLGLDNEPSILLNAGGVLPEEVPQVRVYLDDSNQLGNIKKGQKITVIGECEGIYGSYVIRIRGASIE